MVAPLARGTSVVSRVEMNAHFSGSWNFWLVFAFCLSSHKTILFVFVAFFFNLLYFLRRYLAMAHFMTVSSSAVSAATGLPGFEADGASAGGTTDETPSPSPAPSPKSGASSDRPLLRRLPFFREMHENSVLDLDSRDPRFCDAASSLSADDYRAFYVVLKVLYDRMMAYRSNLYGYLRASYVMRWVMDPFGVEIPRSLSFSMSVREYYDSHLDCVEASNDFTDLVMCLEEYYEVPWKRLQSLHAAYKRSDGFSDMDDEDREELAEGVLGSRSMYSDVEEIYSKPAGFWKDLVEHSFNRLEVLACEHGDDVLLDFVDSVGPKVRSELYRFTLGEGSCHRVKEERDLPGEAASVDWLCVRMGNFGTCDDSLIEEGDEEEEEEGEDDDEDDGEDDYGDEEEEDDEEEDEEKEEEEKNDENADPNLHGYVAMSEDDLLNEEDEEIHRPEYFDYATGARSVPLYREDGSRREGRNDGEDMDLWIPGLP